MDTTSVVIDDLLDPVSADQPAGADLRWTAEWDRIKEARRADDGLVPGNWAKKESKAADWRLVLELALPVLRERSKDLQVAMWVAEANLKLRGFPGLREGLRLTRELLARYWDKGLYPPLEDGPQDRAGPLQWLNGKLVDSIVTVPITARADQGQDYSLLDLKDARDIGSESNWKTEDGIVDEKKKKAFEAAIAHGHISMDMFRRAVKETKRADYEKFYAEFQECYDEFAALEKTVDEKFGDAAPGLADFRSTLRELQQEISSILDEKRAAEPGPAPVAVTGAAAATDTGSARAGGSAPVVVRFPLALPQVQGTEPAARGSWQEAEMLVRSGQIDKGLAQMTQLAASETNGRHRFMRKLLLAEICLASNRERLGRLILEELAEQIDKYQLESWESSELVGTVWTRLYGLYKSGGGGSADADRAEKLYERLCRLDPWQALACAQ
jgi:type VI secretion system protein ImpA